MKPRIFVPLLLPTLHWTDARGEGRPRGGKQQREKQGSGRRPLGLLGRSRLRGPRAQAQSPGRALGAGFPSQETQVPSLGLPVPEK